jgi:transcriptional regulator with XRE-family HTH domain
LTRLFGSKLRHLRQQAGLTQTDLAHALSLAGHGHITNLETGQDAASLDLIIRAARHFDVSLDYLLRDVVAVEVVTPATPSPASHTALQPLGAKLRALRNARGWSQGELARQLGLARRGYISNLEAGRKQPSVELAVQMADLFGLTADLLLREDLPLP